MNEIMTALRNSHPKEIAGYKVESMADYLESYSMDTASGEKKTIDLPKSNVLAYSLEGGGAAIVRPSGTEPKIKVYITAVGKSEDDAKNIAVNMVDSVVKTLGI